ncbi:MAG: hypothetical protein JNL11_17915 [Bdellovibrionaceae bacterium]|nr:hypothetical protein [Pseudobdellovibrionaceae bacterium]
MINLRFFLIFFSVCILLISCQKRKAAAVFVKPEIEAAKSEEKKNKVEDPNGIVPALYYIPILNVKRLNCQGQRKESIKNIRGQTLAEVCESDYKTCIDQGACLLNEKGGLRMINFAARRGKAPLFSDKIKKECPFGLGMKDICLDPYYTVAGDLNFHKLGDVIFIPSVRGVALPNGETHDGYFVVRDSGVNLKSGARFDFFTGFDDIKDEGNVFRRLGLDNKENRFRFEKVSGEYATQVRVKHNYPKLNKKRLREASKVLKKSMTEAPMSLSQPENDIFW